MYQKQTERMLADGGVMQEGGTVDEVSGNEVPAGSLKEEVRDDVDAKLSPGEFVLSADVVRYIGLENLMKIRDKAKAGLKQMSDIGQMGNAEEAVKDEEDIGEFSSAVDDVMGEEDSSTTNKEDGVKKMAVGGYVQPENATTYANAPLKGFEMVSLVNDAGNVVYIPYINGKPQLSIPAGYKVKTGAIDTSASTVAPITPTTTVGAPTPVPTGEYGSGSKYGDSTYTPTPASSTSDGMVSGTSPEDIGMLGKGLGMLGFGIPGMAVQFGKGMISDATTAFAASQNQATVAAQLGLTPEEASSPAGKSAIASVIDSSPMRGENIGVTATTGPSGTGAAATASGAAAAEAATNAGYSASAISAGAQAAANATLNGATPAAAANAGGAAAAAAQGIADSVAANTTTETPVSSGYGSGVSSYGSGSIGSQNSSGSSSAFGGGFGSGENSSSSSGYGG